MDVATTEEMARLHYFGERADDSPELSETQLWCWKVSTNNGTQPFNPDESFNHDPPTADPIVRHPTGVMVCCPEEARRSAMSLAEALARRKGLLSPEFSYCRQSSEFWSVFFGRSDYVDQSSTKWNLRPPFMVVTTGYLQTHQGPVDVTWRLEGICSSRGIRFKLLSPAEVR